MVFRSATLRFFPACLVLASCQFSMQAAAEAEEPLTFGKAKADTSQSLIDQLVADSQKHRYQREADPASPLFQAENAAVAAASDISEYNRLMVEVISRYACGAFPAEADYLAGRLPGAGSAMALSKIALLAAQKGQVPRTRSALKQLSGHLQELTGQNLQQVNGMRAEALCLIGDQHESDAVRSTLAGVEILELETRLRKQGRGEMMDLKQAQARLDLVEAKGIDRLRALYLLACAEQQLKAGHRDLALPFFPEVGRLATSEGLPTAQHVLLDLARVCWAGGESREALKAMNVFSKCAGMFPDGADWKCTYLAEAAQILWGWGKKEEAAVWLQRSIDLLPKVFVLESPQAILNVAVVVEKMKSPAAADELVASAAKIGLSQQHSVTRGAAEVGVLLFYVDAKRPVSEPVREILKAQHDGEKK